MTEKSRKFFGLVRDFLTIYLPEQKSSSLNTIKSYKEILSLMTSFVHNISGVKYGKISFEHITRINVEGFLDWLENTKGCSVSTRNQRLAGIRSFVQYAANRNIDVVACLQDLKKIPIKKDKRPVVVKYFSESALAAILRTPDALTKKGLRDLIFLTLLYDTGARNQEMLDITIGDLHLENKSYAVITGKGRKTRLVPIMPRTADLCKRYLEKAHCDSNSKDKLFYTVRNGVKVPMSPDNTEKFIRKYGEIAHQIHPEVPDDLHPHMFRHSRAMHLYHGGMPLVLIAEWLGHSQLETTQIYANADTTMKREAIQKATSAISPLRLQDANVIEWENDEEIIRKLYGLA